MRQLMLAVIAGTLVTVSLPASAGAQQAMVANLPVQSDRDALPLYPGDKVGSANDEVWTRLGPMTVVRNVTQLPTVLRTQFRLNYGPGDQIAAARNRDPFEHLFAERLETALKRLVEHPHLGMRARVRAVVNSRRGDQKISIGRYWIRMIPWCGKDFAPAVMSAAKCPRRISGRTVQAASWTRRQDEVQV